MPPVRFPLPSNVQNRFQEVSPFKTHCLLCCQALSSPSACFQNVKLDAAPTNSNILIMSTLQNQRGAEKFGHLFLLGFSRRHTKRMLLFEAFSPANYPKILRSVKPAVSIQTSRPSCRKVCPILKSLVLQRKQLNSFSEAPIKPRHRCKTTNPARRL